VSDPSRIGFALCLGLLMAFAAAKAVVADPIDPDFFWHVPVAGQLLARGIGPVPDPFSFMSAPGDWTPFSWLGELAMKWTYDTFGLRGVVGGHALCAAAFIGLVGMTCLEATRRLNHGEPRRAPALVATLVAALFSIPFLSLRPVTFALVLLAAMTWLLWRDRRSAGVGGRAVWLVVPLTVVLTNLHLYVILWLAGLAALTAGAIVNAWANDPPSPLHARRARRLALLTAACCVAACCTPMLPGCIENAVWFGRADPMVAHALVSEIGPFHAGPLGKVLALIVAAIVALAIWRRAALGWENLFWLAAGVAILFQMGRFSTVFALIACPILAATMPRGLADETLGRLRIRVAVAATLALMLGRVGLSFPRADTTMDAWLTRNGDDGDGLQYPTAAARFVEANVVPQHGRVLNELTWGGYLIWRLGDRFQVFMDGRTLIYSPEFWERLYVGNDAARLAVLSRQRADAAIVPVTGGVLREPLLQLGWTPAHRDARAMVLVPPVAASEDRIANVEP
jgi:hypothetical protein